MRGSFAESVRNVATSTRIAPARRSDLRVLRRSARRRSQRARDLLLPVALEHIPNLQIVEVLDPDAALEPFAHFLDVVLEAAQRGDVAVVDLDGVANHPHAALAIYYAAANRAAGNDAHLRNLEQLAHFSLAEHDFALFGPEHSFESGPDVFHRLIDDLVELDVDAFALGGSAGVVVRPYVETDDDRAGRSREENVALGDRSDAAMNDFDRHLFVGELRERIGERFRRSALIRLDHYPERARLPRCRLRHEVFQRYDALRRAPALGFAVEPLTTLCNLARFHRIFDDDELITSHRYSTDAEDLSGMGRAGFLDGAAALVEQGANAAGVHAADEVVSDLERTVVDQDRRHGAFARIELCFDNGAGGAAVRVRLQVEDFRLQEDLIEKRVDVGSFLGRNFARQNGAAELLEHDSVLKQILLHLHRIGAGYVDLVDRHDYRHTRVPGV